MASAKKTSLVITLATLAVLAIVFAVFHHSIVQLFTHSDAKQEAQQQLDAKRRLNEPTPAPTPSSSSDQTNDKGQTSSGTDTPGQTSQPADNRTIELNTSQSNGNVVISTKLYNFTDGTCKLTAVSPTKQTTKTAQIVFSRDFSTCAGFAIPAGDLGKGSWKITLDATSAGTTTSKSTTFEVQ